MAEILEAWPEGVKPVGRPTVYPWDEWLDGKIRKLEVGSDFAAKVPSMRQQLRAQAIKKGGDVKIVVLEKDKSIAVQFVKGEATAE